MKVCLNKIEGYHKKTKSLKSKIWNFDLNRLKKHSNKFLNKKASMEIMLSIQESILKIFCITNIDKKEKMMGCIAQKQAQ